MGTSAVKTPPRRTAPRQVRRQQLIRATMKSIAKRGIAGTTMADVAREAGLSQGIINLHFKSKDKLFLETLRCLADEYRQGWEKALAAAGPTPAEKLDALVRLDFSKPVCHPRKLAVWVAFWGEARSRPTYRRLCAERDLGYGTVLLGLCRDIAAEGGYRDADPQTVAAGLSALSDGLWLDLVVAPEQFDSSAAEHICRAFLAGFFPAHFSVSPARE